MTNIEAIEILRANYPDACYEQLREAVDVAISSLKLSEIVLCKDCRWGRDVCGNIECFVDINVPPEYHSYEWFCPNGEKRSEVSDGTVY